MPTTTVKSIGTGGGRDYSTLQSWEDAAPATLVTADEIWQGECYNDSEFTGTLTISGSTVDSTRYKVLTVATGESFADHADAQTNPLRYDQSKGVGLLHTTSFTDAITVSENYFRMSRMQIFRNLSGSANRAVYNSGVTHQRLERCLIESDNDTYVVRAWTNGLNYSCLFVSRSNTHDAIYSGGDPDHELINCTLAVPSDKTAATDGISASFNSGWVVKNCAIFGVANVGTSSGVTYTTCYTDDNTSLPTGVTNLAYDTSTGSGFENTTDATRDFRIKSTSGLIDVGTTDSKGSPDIVGTARTTYDVGAWEFVSGGGGGGGGIPPFLHMPPMQPLGWGGGNWGRR